MSTPRLSPRLNRRHDFLLEIAPWALMFAGKLIAWDVGPCTMIKTVLRSSRLKRIIPHRVVSSGAVADTSEGVTAGSLRVVVAGIPLPRRSSPVSVIGFHGP